MPTSLEVLFSPVEFEALPGRDLSQSVCVVFDILRATSTIVTALANGATEVIPVADIPAALALRRQRPDILLAGEREGLRIHAGLTGGIDFDLGNSPREFTPDRVKSRSIALSTTNGSRALCACAKAKEVLVGSFLNLTATAAYIQRNPAKELLLVCSGTGRNMSYEDLLGAGAFIDLLPADLDAADSAKAAWDIYQQNQSDLLKAARNSSNGRRLMSIPDLRDDVALCFQRDQFDLVAKVVNGNSVRKLP